MIKIHIQSITGYGQYESFARAAVASLEKVFNSLQFKDRVLNGSFLRTNGLSNQELYECIQKAHEVQGPGGEDNIVDLRLRVISLEIDGAQWMQNCELDSRAGTIGIDGKDDGVSALCPQRLELWATENRKADLAGHYAHEYMHIIGFDHHTILRKRMSKTFVYQIGDIVSELIEQHGF
jgi:hypothetical protein